MKLKYPSSSLPALKYLPTYCYRTISYSLFNLRTLYWSTPSLPIGFTDASESSKGIVDSGYASAEEDGNEEEKDLLEILRSDLFEKKFTVEWLTGFISRSEQWIENVSENRTDFEEERNGRIRAVDEAIELLALCAGMRVDAEALIRSFTFSDCYGESLNVELNDEPYENDHEGVGLQTWGSASVLAKCICDQPEQYLPISLNTQQLKLIELGAGTGLLSIVVTKLLSRKIFPRHFRLVASDYHPDVLRNLRRNILHNLGGPSDEICVENLDWSNPPPELFGQFDVVLAADVIYNKQHGCWIKSCAEKLLRRTTASVMWLIIPQRATREVEISGVDHIFRDGKLCILTTTIFPRLNGIGRIDEDGYKLLKIGWID